VAELGFTVVIALAAVSIGTLLLARKVMLRISDPSMTKLVMYGLLGKLVGTAIYYLGLGAWFGGGDADGYFAQGSMLAPIIRSGTFPDQASTPGTPFAEFLTGLVLALTGNSKPVAYFVFSLLGFVGMVLFVLAFRIAVPEGNHYRYAALVLLLPSMLFWASNLGKDSWMVFTLGVASYGSARLLRRLRGGYVLTALGLAGAYMVRPHMAALLGASLAFAFLLRLGDASIRRSITAWSVGLILIALGGGYIEANWADDLGVAEDVQSTSDVLAHTDRMTQDGGSEFAGRPVRTPGDLLHAAITVPFRPFPFEAHTLPALFASLEGLLLLGLFIQAIPRLRSLLGRSLRRPYLALSVAYCAGFIVAFASINNFGILVRQRTQLLPFLLVLLALPLTDFRGTEPAKSAARRSGRRSGPVVIVQQPGGSEGGLPADDEVEPPHRAP
jgi:hypothetical protein